MRWASVLRSQSERPGSSVGWQCRHAATANRPAIRIEPATYPQVSQEIKKEFPGVVCILQDSNQKVCPNPVISGPRHQLTGEEKWYFMGSNGRIPC